MRGGGARERLIARMDGLVTRMDGLTASQGELRERMAKLEGLLEAVSGHRSTVARA